MRWQVEVLTGFRIAHTLDMSSMDTINLDSSGSSTESIVDSVDYGDSNEACKGLKVD